MIVKITRTNNCEEQPIVVGPHCFVDKGHVEDTCTTKYSSDTRRYHVATIPFGNWVMDCADCKPDCANIVARGSAPIKCKCDSPCSRVSVFSAPKKEQKCGCG